MITILKLDHFVFLTSGVCVILKLDVVKSKAWHLGHALNYRKYRDNASQLNPALSLSRWVICSPWGLEIIIILKLEIVVTLKLCLLAISKLGFSSSPVRPFFRLKEIKVTHSGWPHSLWLRWPCRARHRPTAPLPTTTSPWRPPGRSFPWTRSALHRCLVNKSVVLSVDRIKPDSLNSARSSGPPSREPVPHYTGVW